MTTRSIGAATARTAQPKDGSAVDAVFDRYPQDVRARLLALRALILATAAGTPGVGVIEETLKWGQPSYRATQPSSGTTIRIDQLKPSGRHYALYVHCQTDLIASFRLLYPDELTFLGRRAVVFDADEPLPEAALRHCIALALTYHARKRSGRD
ncbi:MAG: DUF1801 domain-containing protein [Phreatobacter sp.]|uniref:DUF1801 domain-containing protein n=1 Tax=Phreatobacter sp. TaxID=1966341 RepID=UPI0027336124|nr:DUF1801 domain-containing protein [Phreatobacter sp.]MDP2800943.1 DUF1801 domain-containing protein [Phreatobacter sp.]